MVCQGRLKSFQTAQNPIYFIVNVHIGLLKMMFSKIGADKLFSSLEMERFSPILSYILI
ncbi:hypothetical protein HMPREF0604_00719 [Neisseria mucosa C102]|uniref:Transposase n=1 Tax=Neisseria mucosa C102 TaxID=435832 RepID=A0ABP2KG91_NEIMU|nr:hypothetical protein HMPREF0604_00719 [Neisseria mucosa C102]